MEPDVMQVQDTPWCCVASPATASFSFYQKDTGPIVPHIAINT